MSQQPLFVYVPQVVVTRPLSEAAPAEGRETAGALQGNKTILPDLLDQIHLEFFESLSENQRRRFNGRTARALKLAKDGKVQVTDQENVFRVAGNHQEWYLVDLNERTCECPDHRAGNICKHRTAAWFIQQALFRSAPSIEAESEPEQEPEAVADPEPAQEEPEAEPVQEVFTQDAAYRSKFVPCESIIYAVCFQGDEPIPVEILDIDSANHKSFVQALPKMNAEGEMIPEFPFDSPFEGSKVRYSTTWVDSDWLGNVKVYRPKGGK